MIADEKIDIKLGMLADLVDGAKLAETLLQETQRFGPELSSVKREVEDWKSRAAKASAERIEFLRNWREAVEFVELFQHSLAEIAECAKRKGVTVRALGRMAERHFAAMREAAKNSNGLVKNERMRTLFDELGRAMAKS